MEHDQPIITTKIKALRIVRFFLFCVLIGGAVGLLSATLRIDELKALIIANPIYHMLAVVAMILISIFLNVIGGGAGWAGAWNAEWREQLLGLITFFWTLVTAKAIGSLLAWWLAPNTHDEVILFLFFVIGLLILIPLQFVAMRAYARRNGIPMWPNVPKE